MFRPKLCLLSLTILLSTMPLSAQAHSDFSGSWKQDNDRCIPRQSGTATITIDQHDPELTVTIASVYGSAPMSRAVKKYMTTGKPSVMRDSEGDEIDTAVSWRDQSLVFSTDEHEDSKVIHSEEQWTVIDNGATLKRVRTGLRGGQTQTLFYDRVAGAHSSQSGPQGTR